jgi:4'-phosphopantetheinyl transferase
MPLWPAVSHAGRLGADEIHVWCAALGDFYAELPRLQATLSPDEQARAGSFRSADDRNAFVVCRGILRQLLAQYLGRDAAAIVFTYGPFGKPEITRLQDSCPLSFSVARSGGLAVYAMTCAGPVGIDVERLRSVPEFEYIASRFFAPGEADMLLTLPPHAQMEAFFLCWTCREAFVKATGEGVAGESLIPDTWQFQSLRPATGYLGTLAHRTDGARLRRSAISRGFVTH